MADDKNTQTPTEEKKKEAVEQIKNETNVKKAEDSKTETNDKDQKDVEAIANEDAVNVEEEPETESDQTTGDESNKMQKAESDTAEGDAESEISESDKTNKLENFNVGDKIVVNYRITEGKKTRIQPFEGLVIAMKGSGISKTFTVRRIGAGNIGVERIFPLYSPNIDSIKVKTRGKVRRAKLYYLRKRVGKAALKVKEKK